MAYGIFETTTKGSLGKEIFKMSCWIITVFFISSCCNFLINPEAAENFSISDIPIVLSGLDVIEQAEITVDEINDLQNKGRVSHLAYELLHFYNRSGRQFAFINNPIHDLCAIAYLIDPGMFSGTSYYMEVITEGKARGLTFAEKRLAAVGKQNTLVLERVNRKEFVSLLIDALAYLDERYYLQSLFLS